MDCLSLIGREETLFDIDISSLSKELTDVVSNSSFLVLGGAGTIGQAVVKEIFKRLPKKLYVVDLSENNLVELVRDIRSSYGYIGGDFRTFALDIGSLEFEAFLNSSGEYDYVLNLSALKHVRSEKDPYTLMRMVVTNVLNTKRNILQCAKKGVTKYFCVSTDKAADPVNLMGASKRMMELFLMSLSSKIKISTARFANVAFSDGSLLHGFKQRIDKRQPIAAPDDIKRYFINEQESGELCLMSCIFGNNGDIFFPKNNDNRLQLISFADIAQKYLKSLGFEPYLCESENEARELADSLIDNGKWPCFFSGTNTFGEKIFEEFYSQGEDVDLSKFDAIGVVKNASSFYNQEALQYFEDSIESLRSKGVWTEQDVLDVFVDTLPNFRHIQAKKSLDEKM